MNKSEIVFHRHTRLADWDYRQCYAYFVTICVRGRECIFGDVVEDEMRLTRRGIVARDCWIDIPNHHKHVELDTFVIMPNHVHGILLFTGDAPGFSAVEATPASRRGEAASLSRLARGPLSGSLSAVIGSYKSAVARTINRLHSGAGSNLWQPNYYDHIVRNDYARDKIRDYIDDNPNRWARDRENPDGDGTDDVASFIDALTRTSPLRGERDVGVASTENAGNRDG